MTHIYDFKISPYIINLFGYTLLIGKRDESTQGITVATVDIRMRGCSVTAYPNTSERVTHLAEKHRDMLVQELSYVMSLSDEDYKHYLKPVDIDKNRDVG